MKALLLTLGAAGTLALALSATPSEAVHKQLGLNYCVPGTYTAPAPPKLYPADPCWKAPAPKPTVAKVVATKKHVASAK
jgi:hypothetical protein